MDRRIKAYAALSNITKNGRCRCSNHKESQALTALVRDAEALNATRVLILNGIGAKELYRRSEAAG
jgi:hypothetical protein